MNLYCILMGKIDKEKMKVIFYIGLGMFFLGVVFPRYTYTSFLVFKAAEQTTVYISCRDIQSYECTLAMDELLIKYDEFNENKVERNGESYYRNTLWVKYILLATSTLVLGLSYPCIKKIYKDEEENRKIRNE